MHENSTLEWAVSAHYMEID